MWAAFAKAMGREDLIDDPRYNTEEKRWAVRDTVKSRVEAGQDMKVHYDHPILLLQHMIWHEGYHHGQIKLALKVAGRPITDTEAGRVTWGVWMRKRDG